MREPLEEAFAVLVRCTMGRPCDAAAAAATLRAGAAACGGRGLTFVSFGLWGFTAGLFGGRWLLRAEAINPEAGEKEWDDLRHVVGALGGPVERAAGPRLEPIVLRGRAVEPIMWTWTQSPAAEQTPRSEP